MARVHGLIYEKNYQLKEDDPARKFKGRGVLLGDQVKDQNMEAALFQDLGNSPATFDAPRVGQITMGVYLDMTCRWRMRSRHIFRPNCQEFPVGLNYPTRHGIPLLIVTNSAVQYVVWSKHSTVILTLVLCGDSIVIQPFKR